MSASSEERARYGEDALRALCARCRLNRGNPTIEAFVLCPRCQRSTTAEERERLVTEHLTAVDACNGRCTPW